MKCIYFLLCRALLVYCLKHYKGDDKIKSFIWDLITPTKEGQEETLLNHSGQYFTINTHFNVMKTVRKNKGVKEMNDIISKGIQFSQTKTD